MRIQFFCDHPYWGGIANNGGSRTILKSVEALNELGHSCEVIARSDKFTWFDHPKPVKQPSHKADWIIAASVSDVKAMRERCQGRKQAWWVRGFETWQEPMRKIEARARKVLCFANSHYQCAWLEMHKAKPILLYPGYDTEWKDLGIRKPDGPLRIGCLYSDRNIKRFGHFRALAHKLASSDYQFVSFGNKNMDEKWVDEHYKRPSMKKLIELYSSCHIWFSPTSQEGLHNVPMEAALCGCFLICSSAPNNGIWDYLSMEDSFVYPTVAQAAEFVKGWDRVCIGKTKQKIIDEIGTREQNMKRLVKILKEHS